MSYDYLLVRGKAGSGLEALVEGALSKTIGSVDDVKAAIVNIFPSARWQKAPGQGWYGQADEADFVFMFEPDNQVRMLFMSRCEREAVERVAKELNLAAIDEQSMEQFGG